VFIGHYSVSYAGKSWKPAVPLWLLFLAVQFLDVLWGIFVLVGIEKVRIVPGFTNTNALDLYYMPYTHGLIGALAWSVVGGMAYRLWKGAGQGGFLVGAAVFSHWVLDLIVHVPDLPLLDNRFKVGFGLWNHAILTLLLEVGLLVAGLVLYLRSSVRTKPGGTVGFVGFTMLLVAVQTINLVGAPPRSDHATALTALSAYFVSAACVGWLETRRTSSGLA
jgi:hypothetical protein